MAERVERNLRRIDVGIGQAVKKVTDQREAAAALIVEIDDRLRRVWSVRGFQHGFAGIGIGVVFFPRCDIDR